MSQETRDLVMDQLCEGLLHIGESVNYAAACSIHAKPLVGLVLPTARDEYNYRMNLMGSRQLWWVCGSPAGIDLRRGVDMMGFRLMIDNAERLKWESTQGYQRRGPSAG